MESFFLECGEKYCTYMPSSDVFGFLIQGKDNT
jgi:hypothetical protein